MKFRPSLVFPPLVLSLLLGGALQAVELPTLRFDMGTESSPVAAGARRVTPGTAYTLQRGYGWTSGSLEAKDAERPPVNPAWRGPGGQVIPRDFILYKEHDDVTRDAVFSREDLVFRADVPNGLYRVTLTLGDLQAPACSMQVYINDQLVGRDVDARHLVRRAWPDAQYGFPRRFRHTVQVRDGSIRIRIHGDDSGFKERFLAEYRKDAPISYLIGEPARGRKPPKPDLAAWGSEERPGSEYVRLWVWEDIGGPFTRNSVMGIDIYPFVKPPLWWESGKLATFGSDPQLKKAADLFNAGGFAAAEKAFDAVKDDYGRALGYLWLAGRPQYEEEQRLVPRALELLEKLAPGRAKDLVFAELLENARRMNTAILRFVNRAKEQRTYNELLMISGEVSSMQPEDPTYYKGLIYAARGLYMILPHRWGFSSGAGRQLLEKVRGAGFGDNRFVRWYLDDAWTDHPPDWVYADYSAKKQGAPAWAAEVYEAYNRELDLAAWWIRNRQVADGSLGGGWGDDVEILRSLGTFGSICPDAEPLALQGTRRVADGAWHSGSVDTEAGYFAEVGDTEHTGEWTADTLVPMIRLDYGNPVYVERALKTGKLMRDLWMERNRRGQLLMRSNFLGASGVGGGNSRSDSRINFRPALPARMVLWYNNLPTLRQIFVGWADAWLEASLSTERGKPRGIIPQEIAWEDGLIGGVNSPAWFRAAHDRSTVNSDWEGSEGYHEMIVDLFLLAFEATGDKKYLEPMELEAAFVGKHPAPGTGGPARAAQGAGEGSDEWISAGLAAWPAQWEKIRRILFPEQFPEQADLTTLQEAAALAKLEAEWARKRWPNVTSECIATDRVHWPEMGNARQIMTGIGVLGAEPLVTYSGLGREFAAAVLRLNASALRVVLYNISQQEKSAGVIPWLLQVGAEYDFRIGPDSDSDGRMDGIAEQRTVRLRQRGQAVEFRVAGRSQVVIELSKRGQGAVISPASDLGLAASDIRFVPEYRRVDVTVHNVGSERARGVTVALFARDKEVGRVRIPNIEAPLDLDPKSVRVSFAFQPAGDTEELTAVVDPAGEIEEITKLNNRATAVCDTRLGVRKSHAHP